MNDLITPFELKRLRKEIGASLLEMSHLLGLSGKDAATSVRKMENGSKNISMPIQRVAKTIEAGTETGGMKNTLPKFLISEDLTGRLQKEFVIHTRYPRFIAIVSSPDPIDGLVSARIDEIEALSVFMWIDEPIHDPHPIVIQAAHFFKKYTESTQDN